MVATFSDIQPKIAPFNSVLLNQMNYLLILIETSGWKKKTIENRNRKRMRVEKNMSSPQRDKTNKIKTTKNKTNEWANGIKQPTIPSRGRMKSENRRGRLRRRPAIRPLMPSRHSFRAFRAVLVFPLAPGAMFVCGDMAPWQSVMEWLCVEDRPK